MVDVFNFEVTELLSPDWPWAGGSLDRRIIITISRTAQYLKFIAGI